MVAFAKLLQSLLNCSTVPLTSISNKNKRRLQTLFDTGVLEKKRVGPGQSVVVKHIKYLEKFAEQQFPSGLDAAIHGTESRAESVAVYRDAKYKYKTDREFLLVRAISDKQDLLYLNGKCLPVASWCQTAGVAAVRLRDTDTIEISGTIGLVENIDVFWFFENIGVQLDLIYFTGGRFSGRFCNNLVPSEDLSIVHFGDYDPVGVDEYLRIKKKFKSAEFYIPSNIESFFKTGKESLLTKNSAILNRIRKEKDETAITLVGLMDKYNKGVEQEILLV